MIDGTKLPYVNTTSSIEKSKEDIDKLLKKFGCRGIQWTWLDDTETLRFLHDYEYEGIKKGLTFEITIPEIGNYHGRGYNKKLMRNDNQAYRMVLYLIKSKLVSIETGIETFENEFLSKILYSLPDGRTQKVGDVILRQISGTKPIELLKA